LNLRYNALAADSLADAALETKARTRVRAVEIPAPVRSRTSTIGKLRLQQAHAQASTDFNFAAAENDSASEAAHVAAKRFRQFDSRGYDLGDDFKFFGYALKTKEVYLQENLPIFDHGLWISP
jgi:hypothetical protein